MHALLFLRDSTLHSKLLLKIRTDIFVFHKKFGENSLKMIMYVAIVDRSDKSKSLLICSKVSQPLWQPRP